MRRLAVVTLAAAAITVCVTTTAFAETTVMPLSPASSRATHVATPVPSPSTDGPAADPLSPAVLTGRYTVKPWAGHLNVPPQGGLPAGQWPIAGGYIENGSGQVDVWFPLGGTFPIPIVQVGITPETIWGLSDHVIVSLMSPSSDGKYSGTVWISIQGFQSFDAMPVSLTDLTIIPPS